MSDTAFTKHRNADAIAGVAMTLAPLPFIFVVDGAHANGLMWLAAVAALNCLLCGLSMAQHKRWAILFAVIAALSFFGAGLGHMVNNPFAALLGGATLIGAGFAVFDSQPCAPPHINHARLRQQAHYSLLTVIGVIISVVFIANPNQRLNSCVLVVALAIGQLMFARSVMQHNRRRLLVPLGFILAAIWCLWFSCYIWLIGIVLLCCILELTLVLQAQRPEFNSHHWWDILVDHPARILFSTFFILSMLGTLALTVPMATRSGSIHWVDAVFTSVSAVCVTGLSVVDTGQYFSGVGQLFILLLIQLGGLGIMGLTTLALHIMGKRLSLQQERVLSSMTDTEQYTLAGALVLILKVTFAAEAVGSIILTLLFAHTGDSWGTAAWRGMFTAVSAFCNAGFSLQSTSFLAYNQQPLILHTIAALIIVGGLAPATTLIIPRWLRRQPTPLAARLALNTSLVMLIGGMLALLAFEWNGILAGVGVVDKINNAWFQSVTLRTAGFNSVAIGGVASPTLLLMLAFMFIGGSPGGTAGGIKTTTVAVLGITFWRNIFNHNEVVVYNRRIRPRTIYRGITIVGAGVIIWAVIVLMLETTQQIGARDLIFEATSALATVGLSTGATAQLDGIGKTIIIIAMFVGRIGPMTLFMLLSDDHTAAVSRCPDAKISLT